jgi:hypothetical protein
MLGLATDKFFFYFFLVKLNSQATKVPTPSPRLTFVNHQTSSLKNEKELKNMKESTLYVSLLKNTICIDKL